MIEIDGPDGAVIEFPDGTDDATITKAMQKAYPQSAEPAVTTPVVPEEEPVGIAEDVAKSGGTGLVKGTAGLVGAVGAANDTLGWLAASGLEKLAPVVEKLAPELQDRFRESLAQVRKGPFPLPSANPEEVLDVVENVGGPLYEPKTTAGEYAETAGEFVPGAAFGPGGILRRMIAQALLPAITSETAGQLTEGTELEPYARVGGAIVGGTAVPAAASRVVTPFPATPERMRMVETLRAEGVPLTAGQVTGNKALQYTESVAGDIPFGSGRGQAIQEAQGDAFSAALMRRAGENAPAVPEAMRRARDRITQTFDAISARNNIVPDQGLATDIGNTVREYARTLPANQKEVFGNMAGDIVDRFAGGAAMDGPTYQDIRSRLTRMAKGSRESDPEYAQALRGLRNALDDAFARQVQNPEDAAAWRTANRQYGNLKTIERAAAGAAGESGAFGRVSPARIRSAAVTDNRGAYARGEGDFAEIARAGQAIMTPLPNSGTSQRNILAAIAATAGGNVALGNLPGAAMVAGAPALASHAIMSGPGQAYLSNQVMQRLQSLPPRERALLAAALSARGLLPAPQQPVAAE